jgi:hypothetical protein
VDARRVEVRVGLLKAAGWARVLGVRLMEILEVDASSHVLAVPPPSYAEPAPQIVRRVTLSGCAEEWASLLEILRLRWGDSQVEVRPLARSGLERVRADAILVPGDSPPAGVTTVAQLEALARKRVVVVSIPAFTRLNGAPAAMRVIGQADDPMHASVEYGGFISAGFAMHDVFPFAGPGRTPGGFTQRQFASDRAVRAAARLRRVLGRGHERRLEHGQARRPSQVNGEGRRHCV